ncbi:MAG: MFS transporter [Chlamydiales bacterium]|nr:MFS transporter [Chlamydiales bacterium]
MGFFSKVFKAPPYLEELQDQERVDKEFKHWRMRIFYSMFVGYMIFYFTRKSFTAVAPFWVAELNFDKTYVGLLGSFWAISYALGKFTSGIIADRSNPRYFMAFGLLLTGVLNFIFPFTSSITLLIILWSLNGWFQAAGWPPCSRLLMHWYSKSERGTWWGVWNTSHNVGAGLVMWLGPMIAATFGWQVTMFVAASIAFIGSIFLVDRLRDTPRSLGLPTIEKYRNDYSGQAGEKDKKSSLKTKELLVKYVLGNKWVWILSFAYFFVYIARQGVYQWSSFYLIETKSVSKVLAGQAVSFFDWGGLLGSLLSGFLSDRLFSGQRGPVNFGFMFMVTVLVAVFWWSPIDSIVLDSTLLFFIGMSVFGPQMLIGIAVAEFTHKKAAGAATGMAGLFAYIGAAVAEYPLSAIATSLGWDWFFITVLVCCFCALILLSFPLVALYGLRKRKEKFA